MSTCNPTPDDITHSHILNIAATFGVGRQLALHASQFEWRQPVGVSWWFLRHSYQVVTPRAGQCTDDRTNEVNPQSMVFVASHCWAQCPYRVHRPAWYRPALLHYSQDVWTNSIICLIIYFFSIIWVLWF